MSDSSRTGKYQNPFKTGKCQNLSKLENVTNVSPRIVFHFSIHLHPGYASDGVRYVVNDIALLQFPIQEEEVEARQWLMFNQFNKKIRPVCLPTQLPREGEKVQQTY